LELDKITNNKGKDYSLIHNKESMDIMERIMSSLESKTFMKKMLKDYDTLNLLCNHRNTLSIFEDYNFPLLFSIKEFTKPEMEKYFEGVADDERIKTQHIISEVTKKAKPVVKKLLKKYPKYFKGKEVNILRKVLTGKGLEAFSLINKNLPDDKKQELIKKVGRLASADLIPGGISFVNSSKAQIIRAGIKSRNKITKTASIDEIKYENITEDLLMNYKVIEPFVSLFWCENQFHEHYSFYILGHTAQPQIICPICKNNLYFATYYYFKPLLADFLMQNEGLIQVLTMFLVNETEREWLPGVQLEKEDDSEKDIVVKTSEDGYSIIEVKNYVKDNPRARKSNIEKLMKQASNHLENYQKRDINVEKIFLVFNYDYDDEIQRVVDGYLSKPKFVALNNVNLKIIGLNNILELKEDLKIDD
jgi:hypothetical protein